MSNFVEKLIDNELPVNGFKPMFTSKELLRSQKGLQTADNLLKPTLRGFYQRDWIHGATNQDNRNSYFVELTDRFKLGKFILKPQFVFQSGDKSSYRAAVGLDMGSLGEIEIMHQAKNNKVERQTEISHYYSTNNVNDLKNGLNSRATLSFQNLNKQANFRLSSAYSQTLDVLNRKANRLETKTSIYGVDTCLTFLPLRQSSYSLYYQSKAPKYDFISAYIRKSADDKYYSNKFVAGIKCKTANNKILAKASYNLEDRHPQLDLMVRNTYAQDERIKTFHKISSDLKAGSGFTFTMKKLRLHGLAEVNLRNNDSNCQPFSLAFKIEMNDQQKPESTLNGLKNKKLTK